jgi:hypothetical protein
MVKQSCSCIACSGAKQLFRTGPCRVQQEASWGTRVVTEARKGNGKADEARKDETTKHEATELWPPVIRYGLVDIELCSRGGGGK